MYRKAFIAGVSALICLHEPVHSHCQMPCGIYHDDMVFDMVDQYVETMYKAMSELNDNAFKTAEDKNQFCRWVSQKETQSNDIANLFLTYFLQQKIKPDEKDTPRKVILTQKLLFLIVQIKQNVDPKIVLKFADQWMEFKHMFHREDYECKTEEIKTKKWIEEENKLNETHTHDEDHGHPHDHDDKENADKSKH